MNNDRLKFRVWDENAQCYDPNIKFYFLNGDGELLEQSEFYQNGTFKLYPAENKNAERCTGLRDKNGNLIYENDICRVKAASGGYETVLVVWDGAAWRFQCGPWVKLMCFWNPDEIEIIGNIHTQKDGE